MSLLSSPQRAKELNVKCGSLIWRLWLVLKQELKAPQHHSVRLVLFSPRNYQKKKRPSEAAADGGGFMLEVAWDLTLDRQNNSCSPITAAARRLPQPAAAAADSLVTHQLSRVYKPPACVLRSGSSHTRPQVQQIKVDCSRTQKEKCFPESFVLLSFCATGSSQNWVLCEIDSVC